MSNQHEIQRYGKRAPGLDTSKRVNKATFMNQIEEKRQQQMYLQQQQMQQQENQQIHPVQEEQQQHHNQIPDGGIDDDESAATEVADGGADDNPSSNEWNVIIDALWAEYDVDGSGNLDKKEIMPLAQAALS